MKILFWVSFIIIFYAYIGYPAIVYFLSLFYKERRCEKYIYPGISIIMSVYNEENNIKNKLESISELNYPRDKMEVLIGSDGSNDRTNEIIAEYQAVLPLSASRGCSVKLYAQARRQGKPSMLNMLVKKARGDLLVFTDARQILDKDSVKELVKNFSESSIGSVSAELFFRGKETQAGTGVGLYWKYEKFIRRAESRIGSMLGATGALYAIRRELFCEVPQNLILDDMYIPMSVIKKGYRTVSDNKAKIYDRYPSGAREEFARKARTLAGNFQLFANMIWFPGQWQFISHKFLRLMVPYLLAVLFVSNFYILFYNNFYVLFFIGQFLFYMFAYVGMIRKGRNRLFDVSYMFCVMNAAAVKGFWNFLTGKQEVAWKK